jgi:hypothetical protein
MTPGSSGNRARRGGKLRSQARRDAELSTRSVGGGEVHRPRERARSDDGVRDRLAHRLDGGERHRRAQGDFQHAQTARGQGARQRRRMVEFTDGKHRDHRRQSHDFTDIHK